jgi:RNA polymerase sigma factor (TIGR02999 family)
MSDVTAILGELGSANAHASSEILPLVYEELRRQAAVQLARQQGGQTLQPTALVHEAWLRLVADGDRTWRDREHFFRAAAQAMRHILVDRARNKLSLKRGGCAEKISLEYLEIAAPAMDNRVLLVDQCLDRLEKEDPESARIISLKFFAGLTNREVAAVLNATERSIERQWAYARAALFKLIQQEN